MTTTIKILCLIAWVIMVVMYYALIVAAARGDRHIEITKGE